MATTIDEKMELRPQSFRLNPEITSLPYDFSFLKVPPQWIADLLPLQAQKSNRDFAQTTIPHAVLNQAMRALLPDLMAIEKNAWRVNGGLWLLAADGVDPQQSLNPSKIFLVIQAWARRSFTDPGASRIVDSLNLSHLIWQQSYTDLATYGTNPNGTPQLDSGFFHLLPNFIAARLCTTDAPVLVLGDYECHLRRATLAPGNSGAELISWPPIGLSSVQGRGKHEPFSVVITFKVQTQPFSKYPVLHCGLSVRRWMIRDDIRLPGQQDTNVHLLSDVPFLRGLRMSPSFGVAPMRWGRVPDADRPEARWGNTAWKEPALTDILNDLQAHAHFPTAEDIRATPARHLREGTAPCVAVPFHTRMSQIHSIGSGLFPFDHRMIFDQISARLAPELVLTHTPPSRGRSEFAKPKSPFPRSVPRKKVAKSEDIAKQDGVEEQAEEEQKVKEQLTCDRLRLTAMRHKELAFEVFYDSSEIRDACKNALCTLFNIPPTTSWPYVCPNNGLTIQWRERLLGSLGDALEINPKDRTKALKIEDAHQRRSAEIEKAIDIATIPTVTLVETRGVDGYGTKAADPKQAIRIGLSHRGRLTQFILSPTNKKDEINSNAKRANNEATDLAQAARSSFLDAIRQLGIGVQPPHPRKAAFAFPPELRAVGLWLAQNDTGYLPIFVEINQGGEVRALVPGMDQWLPYWKAQLWLGNGRARGVNRPTDALPFIKEIFQEFQEDTLLMCEAQNLRQCWKYLQNTQSEMDRLSLVNGTNSRSICEWRGLRVACVRTTQSDEVPQSYGAYSDGRVGNPSGVFQVSDRVFFALNPKPSQAGKRPTTTSKFGQWKSSSGKTHNASTREPAWNPNPLEITMLALQPGDLGDPEAARRWAGLVHAWRDAAPHYSEATRRPLPLHLAAIMTEYLP